MGMNRTHHEGAHLPGEVDVVTVATGSHQQPRIFLAADRLPDPIFRRHGIRLVLTLIHPDYLPWRRRITTGQPPPSAAHPGGLGCTIFHSGVAKIAKLTAKMTT